MKTNPTFPSLHRTSQPQSLARVAPPSSLAIGTMPSRSSLTRANIVRISNVAQPLITREGKRKASTPTPNRTVAASGDDKELAAIKPRLEKWRTKLQSGGGLRPPTPPRT